jgi:hypothetical protein
MARANHLDSSPPRLALRRASRLLAAGLLGCLGGCYTAELDEGADNLYVCVSADDCAEGDNCVDGLCTSSPPNPVLTISQPEEGTSFPAGAELTIRVRLSGSDLQLAPTGEDRDGEGFVRVFVDGEVVEEFTTGDLSSGLETEITLTAPEQGLHRIRARAFRRDGRPYTAPVSTSDVVVWVDDGVSPYIGIRRPWPGDQLPVTEPVETEVICLRCRFVDPMVSDPRVPGPPPEGHVHVFFNLADFPQCLPDCNFDYPDGGTLVPSGAPVTSVSGAVSSAGISPGDLVIDASYHFTGHVPVPAMSLDQAEWDADPTLYDRLINDRITVTLVSEGG